MANRSCRRVWDETEKFDVKSIISYLLRESTGSGLLSHFISNPDIRDLPMTFNIGDKIL
jgi:hypothetical protein